MALRRDKILPLIHYTKAYMQRQVWGGIGVSVRLNFRLRLESTVCFPFPFSYLLVLSAAPLDLTIFWGNFLCNSFPSRVFNFKS
jgi:hypothetical protein